MKPGRILFWVAALAAIGYVAYTKLGGGRAAYYDASTKAVVVSQDDPRVNAAMETARASVGEFIAALKAPKPGQELFAIKVPISEGTKTEHVWTDEVTFDGTNFHGIIDGEPQQVKSVKLGDRVTTAPSQIRDWKYIQDGKLVGGFTIRAMRDALSAEDRAAFDAGSPFRIE